MSETANPEITFVIPCLNEETNVVPTIESILEAIKDTHITYEIIVYDDNSADGTSSVVNGYIETHKELPVKLKRNSETKGISFNYRDGAVNGRGKYICLIGGDNDVPTGWVTNVLKKLNTADVILPYFEKDMRAPLRIGISKLYTAMVNLLSGYSIQYYNSAVHLRENVIKFYRPTPGVGFFSELTVRVLNMGATYAEVSVPMNKKEHTIFSQLFKIRNLFSIPVCLSHIARLRIAKHPMKQRD
ncbi:MAG: glycosyltransferase [Nitrospirae bacterium]|nr:glycosyltransferase [Nitrospirota bacterium]